MRFANLGAIHLLWFVVFLVLFYFWAFKKRKATMERFAQKDLIADLASSLDKRKTRLKVILIILAVFLVVLSFSRPQWGFYWQEVKRKGLDIIIAVDISKSMLASDVKPNRLERAKLAIKDFIRHLQGDRVGLIAFAGEAFLQCPLTVDYGGFLLSVDSLNVNLIPRGGTSISRAVKEAIRGYEDGLNKYKALIIITDGEDHEGNAEKAAEEAKKEGVKIFCIGIGTPQGELITLTDEKGSKTFLKDNQGNVVKTRLDETTLQKIVLTTGGSYIRSGATRFGLNLVYEEKLSKMEKREFESKLAKQFEERFQIPLGLAFLLLIGELFITERKKGL
ncbi:MAG: VWA domain-containing protein [Candidatus Omnitrophota bacterium]|nr:VWA domain-containing protein [Candidatus Omnitrophota bacterium]